MGETKKKAASKNQSANLGFEAKLWLAADSRGEAETAEGNRSNNMDAADSSGARKPAQLGSPKGQRGGAEQYKAENIFWVPQEARFELPSIGKFRSQRRLTP